MSKNWMLMHNFPLFIIKWPWLKENIVWYPHLSYVMQKRTPSHMHKFALAYSYSTGYFHCHFCNTLRMAFCLFVPQVKSLRPAFKSAIIGQNQFNIRALKDI